jgi:hypothetical protein
MELPTIRPEVFGALSVAARHRRTIMWSCGDRRVPRHLSKIQKLERRALALAGKNEIPEVT